MKRADQRDGHPHARRFDRSGEPHDPTTPERVKFEEMIQRVVFTKLKSGQLDESGLTLEDIRTLSCAWRTALVNRFHGRIKYPWQEQETKRGESQRKLVKAKPN